MKISILNLRFPTARPARLVRLVRLVRAGRADRAGFTLVELLVVIAIIGVLAAFLIPVAGSVSRTKKINTAQAELQQIETELENYKARYGSYPPANTNSAVVNPLYYELSGVTNYGGQYQTLDGNSIVSAAGYASHFRLGGVVNCSHGTGEDTVYAKDFLPGIKANQVAVATNSAHIAFYYLVTSVGGPDLSYPNMPFPGYAANPFRYAYPGTNNPNSYDLWVQLSINSSATAPNKYLICNWSQIVQHNNLTWP